MAFVGVVSFVAGMVFLSMGAWPVFGFFGLDVLAIYWAFKVNFRRATAYEEIAVTPSALHVRRVTHLGAVSEWTLQSAVGAARDRGARGIRRRAACAGIARAAASASRVFLGPDEKLSFAKALTVALNAAKRGVDLNPVS